MGKLFETFERIFIMVCVLLTFGLVCWCVYEYQLDLDLSLVSIKEFGEDDNMIMPTISMCFFTEKWKPISWYEKILGNLFAL